MNRKPALTILHCLLIFTLMLLPFVEEARAVDVSGVTNSPAEPEHSQSSVSQPQSQTIASTVYNSMSQIPSINVLDTESVAEYAYSVSDSIYSTLPPASFSSLPRWRGFNLVDKCNGGRMPYQENDFKWISEFGFNFVRLPIDYRSIIKNGNYNVFDDNAIKDIDQAIDWGEKYNIHVCINFHRAPGYSVLPPAEPFNLWTDLEPQQLLSKYWAFFARRYKGIPNSQLSFNLINEPSGVSNQDYTKVVSLLCDAIRKEDPNRLIISDGNIGGLDPVPELADLHVAQSGRGYQPSSITGYQVPSIDVNNIFSTPKWPTIVLPYYIYGNDKSSLAKPIAINGDFKANDRLSLHVDTISNHARIIFKADGNVFYDSGLIKCGPGTGDWKKAAYIPKYNIYQNVFDRDYTATLFKDTKQIEISLNQGDWLTISQIKISFASGETILKPTTTVWGVEPQQLFLSGNNDLLIDKNSYNKESLLQDMAPWLNLKSQGTGVMIGEFGCYNKTPHDVTLNWMRDNLESWKQSGLGWALWNFRGSWGILDSGRSDVNYENFHGHKLDRQMLELLQQY